MALYGCQRCIAFTWVFYFQQLLPQYTKIVEFEGAHTRRCRWCIAFKSLPTTRCEYLLNCMTAIHLVRLIWIVCTVFVCIVSCNVLSDDLFPIFAFVSHFNNKPFDDNNNTQLSWFCSLLFHWVFSCCLVKLELWHCVKWLQMIT